MSASNSTRLRFGRPMRLKLGRDFTRLRTQGSRLAMGCLAANWQRRSASGTSRLGVVVGRKLGGAVVRSRVRRLLREVFRRHQHELAQPVDLVLVARPAIVGKRFSAVEQDFLAALQKAGLLRCERPTAAPDESA